MNPNRSSESKELRLPKPTDLIFPNGSANFSRRFWTRKISASIATAGDTDLDAAAINIRRPKPTKTPKAANRSSSTDIPIPETEV
jgi:hypothetical protein